jgi:hypothetical protein
MDRLKLETVYLRALDALMSAVDEYQIQAAIFRLRRAQARLHEWEVQGSPTIHSHRRMSRAIKPRRPTDYTISSCQAVIRFSGNIPHGRLDSAGLLRPRARSSFGIRGSSSNQGDPQINLRMMDRFVMLELRSHGA